MCTCKRRCCLSLPIPCFCLHPVSLSPLPLPSSFSLSRWLSPAVSQICTHSYIYTRLLLRKSDVCLCACACVHRMGKLGEARKNLLEALQTLVQCETHQCITQKLLALLISLKASQHTHDRHATSSTHPATDSSSTHASRQSTTTPTPTPLRLDSTQVSTSISWRRRRRR